jgi:KDO2-lipid IV(A) lauroyltransferase
MTWNQPFNLSVARTKSRFAIQAEFYSLRTLFLFLQVLPFDWSRRITRAILHSLLQCLPQRRQLIKAQLAACFPEKSEASIQQLAEQSINTLADGVAAFPRIPRMTQETMPEWVETEGFEHIDEAFRQGRGMITFTAHMGCWELMAVYVTQRYPRVAMVVRPLDNPLLDSMITGVRASGGGGVIDSHRVLKEGMRLLRANGVLGVLIDQNFYKGGVFVDFFGRPAATTTLVPLLARRTGCAVLPMHNVWRNGKIHIRCEAPISLSQAENPEHAIAEDTQQLTTIVERWIREDPEQWLWLHNRWKRSPQAGERIFREGSWSSAQIAS